MSEYEEKRQKRVLKRAIWVTVIACLAFGLFNLNLASWTSAAVIFCSALMSLAALLLTQRGFYTQASILVCLSVLTAITFSIYDGDGLLDPGIIGYSLFILLGTLLLDKRYTPWLTAAAILSLGLIAYLQAHGFLHLTIHEQDGGNFVPISIFLIVGALIVWVILDNLQKNYERLRASELDLIDSYELTIHGWAKALDIRDLETGEHTLRVVEMVAQLAEAMQYPQKDLLFLRYGAYLHDIGKLGIPDAILRKPGPLSPEEWEIMRTHPLKAEEMLAEIPYLKPAMDIPKYHHEYWDGSGYPYQLKGDEIPLAARMFAVVDVWDALSHPRPYREAWPIDRVRSYIKERSGKQFDPNIVQVFLQIIR